MMKVLFVGGVCVAAAAPTADDLKRAQRAVPRSHLRGEDAAAIRTKLNAALTQGSLKMPLATPCKDFSLQELAQLQKHMFELRSPELMTEDLRAPRHASSSKLMDELMEEMTYVREHPEVEEALRDGKCAEVAMQWVHHISEDARKELSSKRLPLLADKGTAEHSPMLINNGHHHVAKKLASQITCQSGHDAKTEARGDWSGYPAWPFEVEYNATGYGPYPFWTAGGAPPSPSAQSPSTAGAPIHTYWSAVHASEKFEHNGNCDLTGVGGGFTSDGPCVHLMLGSKYAYLYDKEQTHCCVSSQPSYTCHMTPMQREFYKVFEYKGEIENYKSESGYYTGKVKHYSTYIGATPSGNNSRRLQSGGNQFYFWYVTDEAGKPIEQGEGGCDFTGSHSCSNPPKYLYHQYDPSTFKATTLDPSVFAVPEVCQKTQSTCLVTPTFFCGDSEKVVVV